MKSHLYTCAAFIFVLQKETLKEKNRNLTMHLLPYIYNKIVHM